MSSNEPSANQSPEKQSGPQNGAGGKGGLPGLAAFGQMQSYTPVGRKAAPVDEPEPAPEPEPQTEPEQSFTPEAEEPYEAATEYEADVDSVDADYADQFAQDFVRDFNQQPQAAEDEQAFEMGDANAVQPEEDYAPAEFSSEEIQNYMNQQHAGHEVQDYDQAGMAMGEEPAPFETGSSLKTFEARYDQHPEIPLGAFDEPGAAPQGDQPFFEEPEQAGDADFLGGQSATDVAEPKERRGRKALMAASGLIGVLALGGALAFAYKIGGDSDIARTGKPPLIQADSRPVKVAPDKPGGKEFPHANKKIYERLGGDKSEEVVKIQPRQEDVAAAATAALGGNQSAQAGGSSGAILGGPRKVKTLTVRPDGSIEQPADSRQKVITAPPPSEAVTSAPDGTIAMRFPSATPEPAPAAPQAAAPAPVAPTIPQAATPVPAPAAEPTQQASAGQAPAIAAPTPVQKPAVPRVAAATPAPAPVAAAPSSASASSYVVQVAARRSQTDALAAFADIQQKYPRLLDGYRPIIKRADLGDKGVWYRLNVGPVESKKVASSLCGQLKSAGMRSCLVRAQ